MRDSHQLLSLLGAVPHASGEAQGARGDGPHGGPRARLGDHRAGAGVQPAAGLRAGLRAAVEIGGPRDAGQVGGAGRPGVRHQAVEQGQTEEDSEEVVEMREEVRRRGRITREGKSVVSSLWKICLVD